jgi:hypothetical protein
MHLKTNNSGLFLMHPKVIKPPTSLTGRNIACVKIQLYFIFAVVELHSCTIVPLVDVFVDVLDCLDRRNALDIDVESS